MWSRSGILHPLEVQKLELASFLLTYIISQILLVISGKVLALCMLNLKALLIVHGSKHTHGLPLGFPTKTKLCTQSVASLM